MYLGQDGGYLQLDTSEAQVQNINAQLQLLSNNRRLQWSTNVQMSQNNIAIQEALPRHEVLEKLSLVAASLHALLYPMWGVVDSFHSCLMIVAWFSHSFIQQAMWFLYFMRYFHSLMMIVRPWWLRPCLPS